MLSLLQLVWMERNDRIFEDKRGNLEELWKRVIYNVVFWSSNLSFKEYLEV